MASKNGIYNIKIEDDNLVKTLLIMAINDDTAGLSPFIVKQMTAMSKTGVPYIDLWKQCEALTKKLEQLSK